MEKHLIGSLLTKFNAPGKQNPYELHKEVSWKCDFLNHPCSRSRPRC